MGSVTPKEPDLPLAPIEKPPWKRAKREREWADYWRAICSTDAGKAMVIRGHIRKVNEQEDKFDKEGWPCPPLPKPVAFPALAA